MGLENKKRKKYCKKSSIKKACKYTCKKECVCDDIEKSECKKIYKKKTMKEVVDLCIEEPELQTDCPSACQGWCNKKMRWIEEYIRELAFNSCKNVYLKKKLFVNFLIFPKMPFFNIN